MELIVDSHGNDWNRVDQKFSIRQPIPFPAYRSASCVTTTDRERDSEIEPLNRIMETVLARCPSSDTLSYTYLLDPLA